MRLAKRQGRLSICSPLAKFQQRRSAVSGAPSALRCARGYTAITFTNAVTDLPLADIKDGGAQSRAEMHPETVQEYAEAMRRGDVFPPVDVFFDGADYWLGEGYHRVDAARQIGREMICADVRPGTKRDAILHGIGANATHGLRRSQADKRRAVERLLTDPEWARWSDRKIAEAARVDHKTVAKIRRDLSGEIPISPKQPKPSGRPPQDGNGLLRSFLETVSDEALLAECRRRGLTLEGDDGP
jgi:hypothetical protein